MITYNTFTLDNGLRVFVHEDQTNPVAVMNILYNVGSRDEEPHKTGFAHLFEHLMFGGSVHVPSYDTPLQKAGAENNAFTTPDITNYYIQIPAQNIETAFWLESDRMLGLSFDEKVLDVQKKVVIEEFKQRYLNQPFGDAWLHLRDLAYTVHPYKWPTIGKEISHIERINMQDVKNFFNDYYAPNNAIMVVGGHVSTPQIQQLSKKWFENIPYRTVPEKKIPKEPIQSQKRTKHVYGNVPSDAIYKVWHMCSRTHPDFYATDLLSDMLGRGQSSRLYLDLVKSKQIFSTVNAYVTGSSDEGLVVIEGKLHKGISFESAENAINHTIQLLLNDEFEPDLIKVKNQAETSIVLAETELLNRCMHLAICTNLGNTDLVNEEGIHIQKVTTDDIKRSITNVLREENSSVIYYHRT